VTTAVRELAEVLIESGGDLPRYELPEWRDRFGTVAGLAGGDPPWDFRLIDGAPTSAWQAFQTTPRGFRTVQVSRQPHGARVARSESPSPGLVVLDGADAHVTRARGVLLAVTVADCVPVYLYHPGGPTVAMVHVGWRGLAAGVIEAALEATIEVSGGSIRDMVMHCGVSICGACYEVGSEVFHALGLIGPTQGGLLDLREVAVNRAQAVGVRWCTVSPWCTAHVPGFASHRASAGTAGRMAAYVGLPMP
jgi:hypothetical protein